MPVTLEQVEAIRDELFAHDIEPIPEMLDWSEEDVTKFFESDGQYRPAAEAPPTPPPPGPPTPPAPLPDTVFRVIFKPRVAIRSQPSATAAPAGAKSTGSIVHGAVEDGWLRLDPEPGHPFGYIMLKHPEHGVLLEPAPEHSKKAAAALDKPPATKPPAPAPALAAVKPKAGLKKDFGKLTVGRKACGANLKTTDAAGASRDALFDHFVLQEVLQDFQKKFRAEGIREDLYDTDEATDTECVTWCQMGGQIAPIPNKKGQRKPAPGGVRQRVEHYGGLRCIIAENDRGSEQPPLLLVLLAHGIHVLGDDLYSLAYHCARPNVRFVLPQAAETSPAPVKPDPMQLRPTLQWFAWKAESTPAELAPRVAQAARQLSECAAAALAAAPGAKLVLGGFSQGAAVALAAAASAPSLRPTALVQLAAQAPLGELDAATLEGSTLLVAAGTNDEVAPVETAKKLLAACEAAGAKAKPLLVYDGEHEVTPDVAKALGTLLDDLVEGKPID